MYNRYIPQPDGTHKRKRAFDQANNTIPLQTICPHIERVPEKTNTYTHGSNEKTSVASTSENRNNARNKAITQRTNSFLQNIFPRELDAGDLLIIILLLLVSGDCPDEQNNALLTLAIYLFM